MNNEVWKPIPDYDGYEVSDQGNVKSIERISTDGRRLKEKILRQHEVRGHYLAVSLSKNGKSNTCLVHKLVMIAFVGKREKGYEINHKDENKHNNNLINLEYITRIENENYGTRNKRISEALKNKKKSEMHKQNISKGRKGIQFTEQHKKHISEGKRKQCGKKVQCIETGIIYDTIVQAEEDTGLSKSSNIGDVCKGRKKSAGGYTWQYV